MYCTYNNVTVSVAGDLAVRLVLVTAFVWPALDSNTAKTCAVIVCLAVLLILVAVRHSGVDDKVSFKMLS